MIFIYLKMTNLNCFILFILVLAFVMGDALRFTRHRHENGKAKVTTPTTPVPFKIQAVTIEASQTEYPRERVFVQEYRHPGGGYFLNDPLPE